MDERLEKALEFSNYMVTLNNQKRVIKEKYYENLIYFSNGAQFTVTNELINFIGFMIDRDNTSNVVVTDDNEIPVMITDLNQFHDDILDVYFSASNDYYKSYSELKSKRRVEKLVDYDRED